MLAFGLRYVRILRVLSKILKNSLKIEKYQCFDSLEWFCVYDLKEKITAKRFYSKGHERSFRVVI